MSRRNQKRPKPPPWAPKDPSQFFLRHQGETAFVLGFGGSLHPEHPHYDGFDWKQLEGRLVIGLNHTIRHLVPTYWFFCDGTIWSQNRDRRLPTDLPIIIHQRMRHLNFPWPSQAYGVKYTSVAGGRVWDPDRAKQEMFMDATVATAGTCFAWHLGAKKIVLVGVDCYAMKGHPYYADGRQLPEKNFRLAQSIGDGMWLEKRHKQWLDAFKVVDKGFHEHGAYIEGLEIINTSMKSPLHFPKKPLAEVLA